MTTARTALITGADGFIGSHLTEHLVENGYAVRALVQYNSFGTWGWLEDSPVKTELDIWMGDVRDPHFCQKLVAGTDLVFHLAALIAIPYSYVAPQSYVDTNVNGTLNICQAALDKGVDRVIHTSTSEVYGTARYVPINEDHPLQPQSPYSASKIGADAIAMSYSNSFDLPLTIARPFNTYGPRQSARAVIPTIITQIANGETSLQLGDLRPTRDFNFVADTAEGFRALAECEKAAGQTINIGSGYEISIGDTANLIAGLMNREVEYVQDEERLRPDNSEVFRLHCDNSQLRALTGFAPRHSIEAGLEKTIEWFTQADNLSKYKHDVYNV
jgi:NAD dependent epimerase/dehydratase